MKNPISVLFASYSDRTQSCMGSIRRHRGQVLRRALLPFLFLSKRHSAESSWKFIHIFWHLGCTRALSRIWVRLWATKDHLNFFPISPYFWGVRGSFIPTVVNWTCKCSATCRDYSGHFEELCADWMLPFYLTMFFRNAPCWSRTKALAKPASFFQLSMFTLARHPKL